MIAFRSLGNLSQFTIYECRFQIGDCRAEIGNLKSVELLGRRKDPSVSWEVSYHITGIVIAHVSRFIFSGVTGRNVWHGVADKFKHR